MLVPIAPHLQQLLRANTSSFRAAQGELRLADKYGPVRLEAACGKAISVGDPSYRTVKGILVAGAETDPLPPQAGDGGAAAFLHGPERPFAIVVTLPMTGPSDAEVSA